MRRPTVLLAVLGVAVAGLTWAAIATGSIAWYLAAGVAWATTTLVAPRLPRGRGQWIALLGVAIAMRVPAWVTPPSLSDDVYRFVWDGRVQRAGENPYAFAPDAPELAPLRDDGWARINHRELPTIYPPGAQLLFRVAPSVGWWKLVVATFDLGLGALLVWWLRRRGGDERLAIAWAWSPLAAIELGQNGHLDGIGAALLTASLAAGPWGRGAWLALSLALKPLGLPLLARLRDRRAWAGFVLALALVVAPFAGAGGRLAGSLGEYGRRWRANDGAFALLQAGAEAVVAHSAFAGRHPMKESPRLARLITGRDRAEVYPDEAASFLARLVAGALYLAAIGFALARRYPPERVAATGIGAFLLLAPTLHPWYALWILPLCAVGASPAWLALAALVPLGYAPSLTARAIEHGIPWAALIAIHLTLRQRPVRCEDP